MIYIYIYIYIVPSASFGFLCVSLERLWQPLGQLWAPFDFFWSPWAYLGLLWSAFGHPLGSLWPSWGIWSLVEIRKEIHTIIDEMGCNLMTKRMIIDERGEHSFNFN